MGFRTIGNLSLLVSENTFFFRELSADGVDCITLGEINRIPSDTERFLRSIDKMANITLLIFLGIIANIENTFEGVGVFLACLLYTSRCV